MQSISTAERQKLYGVPDAVLEPVLSRLRDGGASFVRAGVTRFCDYMRGTTALGDIFREHGAVVEAALVRHYELLIANGFAGGHHEHLDRCLIEVEEAKTDMRTLFGCISFIVDAAIPKLSIGLFPSWKQVMADAMILQRLLLCDAATILTFKQYRISRSDIDRNQRMASELMRFRAKIEQVTAELATASASVRGSSEVVASAAEAAASRSRTAADAATEGTDSLTASAAGTEELQYSTRELERRADSSRQAVDEAERALTAAQKAIADLQSSADKIGSIVGLIGSIAEQT
ncbi:MAG: hypothetical protein ACRCTI_14535, partial [Beijerinckiaceae bacterium]